SNLVGYNVYRASSAAGPFALLNSQILSSPSFNDTTAPNGVMSYYHVVAVDSNGNASAPAVITATRAAVAPGAPTNVVAQATSTTSISLSWSAPSGTADYLVF